MRFKDFINEKKKTEPSWADDYESGYSRLKDMQQYLTARELGPQLFVPKHRDPVHLEKMRRSREWREIKQQFPDEVQESTIPVLTSFREQPPGDNKPGSAFWTSSAIKLGEGLYTSDWYKFVQRTFPQWQTDYGYLFEVVAEPLVFDSSNLDQFYEWAESHGRMNKKPPEYASNYSDKDRMRTNFPWDTLAHHFDAVHHMGHHIYGDSFTYGWDVESTAWFNTRFLKYKGEVLLAHFDNHDD